MHIATRPDATPISAHPYLLALKHHNFLKKEIQNCLMQVSYTKVCPHGQAPLWLSKSTPQKVHPNNSDYVWITEN